MQGSRPRLTNVVAAFATAPLGGAGLVATIAFVAALSLGAPADGVINGVFTSFILIAILGYVAALVLGLPGYLVLRHRGWIRGAHWVLLCAGVGSAAGAVWPAVALLSRFQIGDPVASIGGFAAAGALVGAVSGFVFAKVIRIDAPRADEIAATFD
ncbi:MAG TPA: hypothetical protein VE914_12875 [Candidatus Angelobacter sp.]|nr:hypothetical protein [Candidatus Angelobacter sp.]